GRLHCCQRHCRRPAAQAHLAADTGTGMEALRSEFREEPHCYPPSSPTMTEKRIASHRRRTTSPSSCPRLSPQVGFYPTCGSPNLRRSGRPDFWWHPRPSGVACSRTWMAGTSPAMTLRGTDSPLSCPPPCGGAAGASRTASLLRLSLWERPDREAIGVR